MAKKIAVIGTSCRFAGAAEDEESFYRALLNQEDCGCKIPEERFHVDSREFPTKKGYFMKGPIDTFDTEFFHISTREASEMDPAHRILLEKTFHAFEDAGLTMEQVRGSMTASFVGILSSEFFLLKNLADQAAFTPNTLKGYYPGFAASRLSFTFDLRGPSMVVDTACSSAANCIYLGMQAIRSGEATMAIAAGVNILVVPKFYEAMAKLGVLSSDGSSKAYSGEANGYARGEGIGVVVLKDYEAAVRDGDPIKLVLVDGASMQDGRQKNGLTDPSTESQSQMLDTLYSKCNIRPDDVCYLEGHGTGTYVGDPIEANAIGRVLGRTRSSGMGPLPIGSVKPNIGHTEPVSGIANLIKIMMSFKYNKIPPVIHYKTPNPSINFEDLNIQVLDKPFELNKDRTKPLIAGLNSYGMGGSNVHLIVTEHLEPVQVKSPPSQNFYPILLSAHNASSLESMVSQHHQYLAALPPAEVDKQYLANLSYTLGLHRSHMAHRVGFVVDSVATLVRELEQVVQSKDKTQSDLNLEVVFVCSGQGPQWNAMGRELFHAFPQYKQTIETISNLLQKLSGWSLVDELAKDEKTSQINNTNYAQPAIFAMQVGLYILLKECFGIKPVCVVGHSVGEVAAAHIAGALSLEDAVKVIYHRSLLQFKAASLKSGRMMATGLSLDEAEVLLNLHGMKDRVCVAAVNGPGGITLSGDEDAINTLIDVLKAQGKYCALMRIQSAFHSNHMDSIKDELLEKLKDITPTVPTLPLYSTVTGDVVKSDQLADGYYWWLNVRQEVRFEGAVVNIFNALKRNDNDVCWVELSPHPVLANYIKESIAKAGSKQSKTSVISCQVRKSDDAKTLLDSVTQLHNVGCNVNWRQYFTDICGIENLPQVQLPKYPFGTQTCWYEAESVASWKRASPPPSHPLLGTRMLSLQGREHPVWEKVIRRSNLDSSLKKASHHEEDAEDDEPVEGEKQKHEEEHLIGWLKDHVVGGELIYFPAAGYIEMALCAATQLGLSLSTHSLQNLKFKEALVLPSESDINSTILIRTHISGSTFYVSSQRVADGKVKTVGAMAAPINLMDGSFTLHFTADILPHPQANHHVNDLKLVRDTVCTKFPCSDVEFIYRSFQRRGLSYGPCFQGITGVKTSRSAAWGTIAVPAALLDNYGPIENYFFHPVLVDSALQLGFCVVGEDDMVTKVPVSMANVIYYPAQFTTLEATDVLQVHTSAAQNDLFDLQILKESVLLNGDTNLEVVLEIKGMKLQTTLRDSPAVLEMVSVEKAKQNTWTYDMKEAPLKAQFSITSNLLDSISTSDLSKVETVKDKNLLELLPKIDLLYAPLCVDIISALAGNVEMVDGLVINRSSLYAGIQSTYSRLIDSILSNLVALSILQKTASSDFSVNAKALVELQAKSKQLLTSKYLSEVVSATFVIDLVSLCAANAVAVMKGTVESASFTSGALCAPLMSKLNDGMADVTSSLEPILQHAISGQKEQFIVRILEVGNGSGVVTRRVLSSLQKLLGDKLASSVEYVFADASSSHFAATSAQLAEYSKVLSFKLLEVEKDLTQQGFALDSFDIIIGGQALLATNDVSVCLTNLRQVLAPKGVLALHVPSRNQSWPDLVFGLTSKWWQFEDARVGSPRMSGQQWSAELESAGFTDVKWADDSSAGISSVLASKRAPEVQAWIIVNAGANSKNKAVAENVKVVLKEQEQRYVDTVNMHDILGTADIATIAPSDIATVFTNQISNYCGCVSYNFVYLADFSTSNDEIDEISASCVPLLKIIQSLQTAFTAFSQPALYVVTRGVFSTTSDTTQLPNLVHAPIAGFVRSYSNESKEQKIKLLDVPATTPNPAVADLLRFVPSIVADIVNPLDDETEVSWKLDGNSHVRIAPRIRKFDFASRPAQSHAANGSHSNGNGVHTKGNGVHSNGNGVYTNGNGVHSNGNGVIHTNGNGHTNGHSKEHDSSFEAVLSEQSKSVKWQKSVRVEPQQGQVEVQVEYVALNANNLYQDLGVECSGIVTKVGGNVKYVNVGDEVVCIATSAKLLRSHVVLAETQVWKKPSKFSLEAAASSFATFTTAWLALHVHAQISNEDVVLIYSSNNSVDIAAIQICKNAGAKVIVAAGTEENRLRIKGKDIDHVFDSRASSLHAAVMAATNSNGVDIIFNTASDDLQAAAQLLANGGRLVDISRKDTNSSVTLKSNCTYYSLDLLTSPRRLLSKAISGVLEQLSAGSLSPLPVSVSPHTKLDEILAAGKQDYVGKVLIHIDRKTALSLQEASYVGLFGQRATGPIKGTCLVTGGLGGLGLKLAAWFVDKGVRSVALIARRPPTAEQQKILDDITQGTQAKIRVHVADIGEFKQIEGVINTISNDEEHAPLLGVVHAALVLHDELLKDATVDHFKAVIKPRIHGAHNLHILTQDLPVPLQFFILFSSFSCTMGIPGQGHYNAGNFYLDTLARYRSMQGLPSFSYALPVISGAGYAERLHYTTTYESKGVVSLFYRAALNLMEHINPWTSHYSYFTVFDTPIKNLRLSSLMKSKNDESSEKKSDWSAGGAEDDVEKRVLNGVSKVLGLEPSIMSAFKPLVEYGIDSLVSMDIRNWVEKQFKVPVMVSEILQGMTVNSLALKIQAATQKGAAASSSTKQTKAQVHKVAKKQATTELAPVTSHQTAILTQFAASGPSASFNLVKATRVDGEFSHAVLQRAVNALAQRHPDLSAGFSSTTNNFGKINRPYRHAFIRVRRANVTEETLSSQLTALANTEFDLRLPGPLIRFFLVTVVDSQSPYQVLLMSAHQLVADEASLTLLTTELSVLYEQLLKVPTLRYTPQTQIALAGEVLPQVKVITEAKTKEWPVSVLHPTDFKYPVWF